MKLISISFLFKLLILQYLSIQCLSEDFDFFYFVQQWPGAYCDTKQSCCYPKSGKPAADFSIHGLWPNYKDGSWPSNCDPDSTFDKSQISDLMKNMEKNWPSLSCPSSNGFRFWSHEWEKHGTCAESELDQHEYFETALKLKEKVNLLQILKNAEIEPNDEFYSIENISEAIKEATGFAPGLECNRSKEEMASYQEWFNFADSDGDGRVSGNEATKFFALSNLSRSQLKQLWALSDTKRQGFLGFTEFVTAMQLVSLARAGYELNSDLLLKIQLDRENVKPPVIEGLDTLVAEAKSLVTITAQPEVNVTAQPQSFLSNSWFTSKSRSKKLPPNAVTSIVDGLKRLYFERLKPLEAAYRYNDFVSPLLTNSDFDAKPMVMLLGQYSTGKTTFIKHLLKCDYPGAHIGPEPTTDRFVVVMSGTDERSIPGNTIAVDADMPFGGLTTFGGSFLSKFQCSQMPHSLLDEITIVDTPGVLSGEKQRTQRSYDFTGVVSWFAAKCDVILLLFDPHKLDISDEFKRVISSLRGNEDKIRVVLNKSDQVDTQQLMRVYGALMWSLGKVLTTPEVPRVYIGSFNDKATGEGFTSPLGKNLFEKEQNDLLADLLDIPKKACDHRINEFVKRARSAKIHAYIISHLKKEMPAIMGKAKAQQKLIDNLDNEFAKIQREYHLPAGDFPSVEHFKEVLNSHSIDKFEKLKPKMIQAIDDMLGYEIPELLKNLRNPYD